VGAAEHSAASVASSQVLRAQAGGRWRGWVEQAGEQAPRAPMWTSRQGWLAALGEWAASASFGTVCASAGVSITTATLVAIAAVMAEHADHGTGRHVAITRSTIADRVGCDVRTVTAAWRVLRAAGWAVEAQRGHGSPTTPAVGRRPSVYHLTPRRRPATPPPAGPTIPPAGPTIPAAAAVGDFHLPPSGGDSSSGPVGTHSPSARVARAATSPASPNRSRRRCHAEPRPLAVQRLAGGLVTRCHGLGRGHIGAICDALNTAGVDPAVWSAKAITDALNTDMGITGWSWPDHIDRPAAFLTSRLRRLTGRPSGPPKSGGCAAACPEEKPATRAGSAGGGQHPPALTAAQPAPLTPAQQARIAAARAEIRAVLTHRRPDTPSRHHARLAAEIDWLQVAGGWSPAGAYFTNTEDILGEARGLTDPTRDTARAVAHNMNTVQPLHLAQDAATDKSALLGAVAACARANNKPVLAITGTDTARRDATTYTRATNIYDADTMLGHLDNLKPRTLEPRLIGALFVVDDADHLTPNQLHRLAEHAGSRNIKLLLVTTDHDSARQQAAEPPGRHLIDTAHAHLPWAQHPGETPEYDTALRRAQHLTRHTTVDDPQITDMLGRATRSIAHYEWRNKPRRVVDRDRGVERSRHQSNHDYGLEL
jgi:hypothetical protein